MNPLVSIITPTRNRPESLELCKRWVETQVYDRIEHVIAEDREWKDNVKWGLQEATGDCLIFFDDDDWYSPYYVGEMVAMWRMSKLFGVKVQRAYNVHDRRWANWYKGPLTPSLGFDRSLIPLAMQRLERSTLKHIFRDKQGAVCNKADLIVHLKGIYPWGGMSVGHRSGKFPNKDPKGEMLKKWISEAPAEAYFKITEELWDGR